LVVSEGVVEVRARGAVVRVPAGGTWPPECQEKTRERSVSGEASAAGIENAGATPATSAGVGRPAASEGTRAFGPESSGIGEQNDLFARGVTARKRGDVKGALDVFTRLIAKYPGSALAENALVERMRLLRGIDAAGARTEAHRYLSTYPSGFAHQEAEELLREAP
jgi:hypothetical protein